MFLFESGSLKVATSNSDAQALKAFDARLYDANSRMAWRSWAAAGQNAVEKQITRGDFGLKDKNANTQLAADMAQLYKDYLKLHGLKDTDHLKHTFYTTQNVRSGILYDSVQQGSEIPKRMVNPEGMARLTYLVELFDMLGRVGTSENEQPGKKFKDPRIVGTFNRLFAIYLCSESQRSESAFTTSGLPRVDGAELNGYLNMGYKDFDSAMQHLLGPELYGQFDALRAEMANRSPSTLGMIKSAGYNPAGGNIEIAMLKIMLAIEDKFGFQPPNLDALPLRGIKFPANETGLGPLKSVEGEIPSISRGQSFSLSLDSRSSSLFFSQRNDTMLSAAKLKRENLFTYVPKTDGPDLIIHGIFGPVSATDENGNTVGPFKLHDMLRQDWSHGEELNNWLNSLPKSGSINLTFSGYRNAPYVLSYDSEKTGVPGGLEPGDTNTNHWWATLRDPVNRTQMGFDLSTRLTVLSDATKEGTGLMSFYSPNSDVRGNYLYNFNPYTGQVKDGRAFVSGRLGDVNIDFSVKGAAELGNFVQWNKEHPFQLSVITGYSGGQYTIDQILKSPQEYAYDAWRALMSRTDPKTQFDMKVALPGWNYAASFTKEKLYLLSAEGLVGALKIKDAFATSYEGGDNRRVFTGANVGELSLSLNEGVFLGPNNQRMTPPVLAFSSKGNAFTMTELEKGTRRYSWTSEGVTLSYAQMPKLPQEKLDELNLIVKDLGDKFNEFTRGGITKQALRTEFWASFNRAAAMLPDDAVFSLSIPAIGGRVRGADIRTEFGTVNVGEFIHGVSKGLGNEGLGELTLTGADLRELRVLSANGDVQSMIDFMASRLTHYDSVNAFISAATMGIAMADKEHFDSVVGAIGDHMVIALDRAQVLAATSDQAMAYFKFKKDGTLGVTNLNGAIVVGIGLEDLALSPTGSAPEVQNLQIINKNFKFSIGASLEKKSLSIDGIDIGLKTLFTLRKPLDDVFLTSDNFASMQQIAEIQKNVVLPAGLLALDIKLHGKEITITNSLIFTVRPDATVKKVGEAVKLDAGKMKGIVGFRARIETTQAIPGESTYVGAEITTADQREEINAVRAMVKSPRIGDLGFQFGLKGDLVLSHGSAPSHGYSAEMGLTPLANLTFALHSDQFFEAANRRFYLTSSYSF